MFANYTYIHNNYLLSHYLCLKAQEIINKKKKEEKKKIVDLSMRDWGIGAAGHI